MDKDAGYVCIPDVQGKLAKDLLYWRAERPDEWKMDEFIRNAELMHRALNAASAFIENLSGDDIQLLKITRLRIEYRTAIDALNKRMGKDDG